jgi:hypothetical protein
MELFVKPEIVTSYIYGPTFGNAEIRRIYMDLRLATLKAVSFYLMHNVSTLNQY